MIVLSKYKNIPHLHLFIWKWIDYPPTAHDFRPAKLSYIF